jgi:hypothetical protein
MRAIAPHHKAKTMVPMEASKMPPMSFSVVKYASRVKKLNIIAIPQHATTYWSLLLRGK